MVTPDKVDERPRKQATQPDPRRSNPSCHNAKDAGLK